MSNLETVSATLFAAAAAVGAFVWLERRILAALRTGKAIVEEVTPKKTSLKL